MEEKDVQGTENTAAEPEKTFTQAEVDALIARRLERERKKVPGEEELNAFRSWKERQAEEQALLDTRTRERDEARAELERLRRERFLMERGMDAEAAEFLAFKIGKSLAEGQSFAEAAESFLKENQHRRVRVDTGAQMGAGRMPSVSETMNELLRGTRK